MGRFLLLLLAISLPFVLRADSPVVARTEWIYDRIDLRNGSRIHGLILEDQPLWVRFRSVSRKPGRPTVTWTLVLDKREIVKIERLGEADRKQLQARIDELDPDGSSERARIERLELRVCDWQGKKDGGFRYDSDYFSLISGSNPEILRRSVVRLEQIWLAWSRFLPPRTRGGKPVTILLFDTMDEYRRAIGQEGRNFLNPAFYDPATHRIYCASGLKKLGEDLARSRTANQDTLDELSEQEAEFRRLYAGRPDLPRHLQPILEARAEILKVNRLNNRLFDKVSADFLAVLYHESFHAWIGGFVYPPIVGKPEPTGLPGELPVWLNEGLAQIFESAIVEGGELRIGWIEAERLEKLRAAVRKKESIPIAELLRADSKSFLAEHRGDRRNSARMYRTAWIVAFWLTFERNLSGKPFDEFTRGINRGDDPAEAFRVLTGLTPALADIELEKYIDRLQPDGTTFEKKP